MTDTDTELLHNFATYVRQYTDGFIGREWVFDRIQQWLIDVEAPRFFVIQGDPGCGKSAIAARIYQFSSGTLPADAGQPLLPQSMLSATYFCDGQNQRWINSLTFVEALALQLAPLYGPSALLDQLGSTTTTLNPTLNVQHAAPGSHITNVLIQQLCVAAPSAADAFLWVVRKPLELVCTTQFDQQIIILIDGLDHAQSSWSNPTIAELLADAQTFPQQIRFIVTTSPLDEVLAPLKQAGATICDLSAVTNALQSSNDIQRLIQQWLNQSHLSKLAAGLPQEQFIKILKAKSGTNFLYLRHVLNMLNAEKQRIIKRSLAAVPDTLDELYIHSLQRVLRRHRENWKIIDALVLGTLAVAPEALTKNQLSNLTRLDSSTLNSSLARLRSFLNILTDQATDSFRYSLYHNAFSAFFLRQSPTDEFYSDPREHHTRICEYYERWWEECRTHVSAGFDLEQINHHDGYPFRYLSLHLRQAQKHEALMRLVKDRRWYMAQYMYDLSEASYLNDVQNAWTAITQAHKQAIQAARFVYHLSDEIYCALVIASYHSRADNIPPQLIIRLLDSSGGNIKRVLTAVRHISDRVVLTNVMAAFVHRLPQPEQDSMLQEAVALAATLEHEPLQAEIFIKLGSILPAGLIKEVVAMIQQMKDAYLQAEVLQNLLPLIADRESANYALDQIHQIDPAHKLPLLIKLTPFLNRSQIDEALMIVQATTSADHAQWMQVIKALLVQLVALGDARTALDMAYDMEDVAERANIFVELLPAIADAHMVEEALEAADTIEDIEQWSMIAAALLPSISDKDYAQQVLSKALSVRDPQQRVRSITSIASGLPITLRDQALKQIRALDWKQPHVLVALTPILPAAWLNEAITAADHLTAPAERSATLIALLARLVALGRASEAGQLIQTKIPASEHARAYSQILPALLSCIDLRDILAAIPASASDSDRIQLLQSLMPYLADQGFNDELLSTIATIASAQQRMNLLGIAAEHLPSAFIEKALEQTRMIDDGFAHPMSREVFLVRLAESGQAKKALDVAYALDDPQERAQVLCALLDFVPQAERGTLLDQALTSITGLPDQQLHRLQRLVTKLPVDRQPAVSRIAWLLIAQIEDSRDKIAAFSVWLPFVPKEQREAYVTRAWSFASALPDAQQQVMALVRLAPFLDESQQSQALESVWSLRTEADQARALADLAANLAKPMLREAVSVAWRFRETRARETALVPLLTALGDHNCVDDALADIIQLEPGPGRAEGLIGLAHHLSVQQLRDALHATWEIRDRAWKNKTVATLLFHLTKSHHQEEAFDMAWMLEDEQGKLEALMQMTPVLSHPWINQASLLIQSLEYSPHREQALVYVAGRMAELAETDTALEIIDMIEQPQQKAEAVAKVAQHIPALDPTLVRDAFEAASTIQDMHQRTAIFAELAKPLITLPQPERYDVWCSTLRCSAQRSRIELHADLCALAPIIAILGDPNTVPETDTTLAAIGEWWP